MILVKGVGRVASGVDTLILPVRRSQGCPSRSDTSKSAPRASPPQKCRKQARPTSIFHHGREALKNGPGGGGGFNQALLKGPGGAQKQQIFDFSALR